MKKINIGIIGSGFGLYGLLPAFTSLPECNVVAMCGKNTPRLLKYCTEIGLQNIYVEWEDMLRKESLDAVAIATTPQAQYTIAQKAIEKGIHIFVEKPLAINKDCAEKLLQQAEQKGIVHAMDFIFPEIDAWRDVKNILKQKKYGKLLSIESRWFFESYDIKNNINSWKTDPAKGGGALSFFFSHVLHYLEFFAGPISSLKSRLIFLDKSPNGGDVGVELQLRFKNNISGSASFRCDKPDTNIHQLTLICEKATIQLKNVSESITNFTASILVNSTLKTINQSQEKSKYNFDDERVYLVRKIAKRFIDACAQNKQVVPSMVHGLRVQELIDMIRSQNEILY